jgi:hypothetical protein
MPEQRDHEPVPRDPADIYAWTGMTGSTERPDDYPLSAPCGTCLKWLHKPSVHEPWRHRLPSDLIDEAADREGYR